ncbi:MAG: S8 family serine peptidase [Deltaproteobacteria bacterium]|nr:S8 family serine peptidase [Deltaproteobacteria bacterium]
MGRRPLLVIPILAATMACSESTRSPSGNSASPVGDHVPAGHMGNAPDFWAPSSRAEPAAAAPRTAWDQILGSANPNGTVDVLVELTSTADRARLRSWLGERGAKVRYQYKILPNVVAVRGLPAKSAESLTDLPDVVRVLPDTVKSIRLAESTPIIHADAVSMSGKPAGEGVIVCVGDTGINKTHPAFAGAVVAEHDFANDDGDATDDHGHGTHVAGIVASRDGTRPGVAPAASLAIAKVLNASGNGSDSDVIAAIDWCTTTVGAKVINFSLGSPVHWPGSCDFDLTASAIDASVDLGVVNVVASGNDASTPGSPGCARRAVTVGATYDFAAASAGWGICLDNPVIVDKVVCFSNSSPKLTVVAPGAWITSASHNSNGFSQKAGTSMATPHVAGLVARLLSSDPTLRPNDVLGKLMRSSLDLNTPGFDDRAGFGRVDTKAAMEDTAKIHCTFDADCSDADPCTVESCRGGFCATEPLCDDLDACTHDECVSGDCSHSPVGVDDGNENTIDACDFCLGVTHSPTASFNEECGSAVDVLVGGTVNGDTTGATPSYSSDCAGSTASGPDLVYRVHLAPDQPVDVRLSPVGWDGSVYVLMSDGTPVGCNASRCVGGMDTGGPGAEERLLRLRVPVEGEYFVVVDGLTSASFGPFSLSVSASCDPEDDGRPCRDGNACSVRDVCLAGVCSGQPPGCGSDAECDDGLFCTGAETCVGSVCAAGTPPNLSDGVECTIDSCDELNDLVTHSPNDAFCDDGLFCTGAESCSELEGCRPGVAIACEHLGTPCATGVCDEPSDGCVESPRPPETLCDDANACTTGDHCDGAGNCLGSNQCARFAATASGVSGAGWVSVALPSSLVDPVVVCSAETGSSLPPMVVRVRNVSSTGFEVSVVAVEASRAAVEGIGFRCLAVASGVYTEATHGVKLEAMTYASTLTDRKGSLVGTPRAYAQSYGSPVVVGQVMTANDPNWSVFWARGAVVGDPPSPAKLSVGKNVGEDPIRTRATEVVGYLVFEAGVGVLDGLPFQAGVGSNLIRGFGTTTPPPPYVYGLSAPEVGSVAVVSVAGYDGVDTGWPLLFGPNPVSASGLGLVFDEDDLGDLERVHNAEQVSFVVLGASAACPGGCDDANACTADSCEPSGCGHAPVTDGTACGNVDACDGAESCLAGECVAGSAPSCDDFDPCTGDSCDPAAGCQHAVISCEDFDPCTSDTCDSALGCQHSSVSCDDGSVCTGDWCDPVSGCQHLPLPCDDGTFCNGVETCDPSLGCVAGAPPICSGSGLDSACTAGQCDEGSSGCVARPFADGTPCDDGEICTTDDLCAAGVCVGTASCAGTFAETLSFVSGAGFAVRSLSRSYLAPVVVCSAVTQAARAPLVVRVRSVGATSFEAAVSRVDSTRGYEPGVPVFCLVVEEGVYTLLADGVKLEAVRFNSTTTDRKKSWVGQTRTFQQSYVAPVVLGQVMSANDTNWSVFWARGTIAAEPPSANSLFVGKNVAEDTLTARVAETVGYLVIEAGSGVIGNIRYSAGVGPATVQGYESPTPPPFVYPVSDMSSAQGAIVSQAGVTGVDGAWPLLWGPNPVSATSISLVVDEDAIADAERDHRTERVAYLVFE